MNIWLNKQPKGYGNRLFLVCDDDGIFLNLWLGNDKDHVVKIIADDLAEQNGEGEASDKTYYLNQVADYQIEHIGALR